MTYEAIRFAKAPPRATISLNDPPVQNALSVRMLEEIRDAVAQVERDDSVMTLVIAGAGDHFCSGINLRDVKEMNAVTGRSIAKLLHKTFGEVRALEKPAIAAIRGNCLGGGLELALSCDFLVGAEDSQYGFPHMRIGIPSIVEAGILPQAVGIFRAKELYFTARFWDGRRAFDEGLLYRAVPGSALDGEVDELVSLLSSYSPLAMALQKDIANKWMTADLETAIDHSINTVGIAFASRDQKEGMQAFLEKRKPRFTGR